MAVGLFLELPGVVGIPWKPEKLAPDSLESSSLSSLLSRVIHSISLVSIFLVSRSLLDQKFDRFSILESAM